MSAIRLGFERSALQAGCASAVARVVEAHGFEVDYVDLQREDVPQALSDRRVDIYASAWMPHDTALSRAGYAEIGNLYQPILSCLTIGKVIVAQDRDVECDAILISSKIPVLCPQQMDAIDRMRNDQTKVEVIDDERLYARLNHEFAKGQRILVVAMQPHAVFFDARFKVLDVANLTLGYEMRAPLLLSPNFKRDAEADLIDELSEMMLGVKVMSALDYAISVSGQDPEDAAEAWQRGRLLPR